MKPFVNCHFSWFRITLFAATLFFAVILDVAFSPPALAQTTITVNTTADVAADDGACTLREAITAANTDTASGVTGGECPAGSGADVIVFAIGTGAQTITLGSALPNIVAAVTIDGSTQPGFASAPLITLDASGAGSNPVQLSASNSTLKDFAISGDNLTALMLSSVVTVTLENLDLSKATACTFGGSGTGLSVSDSSHLTVTDVSVANRGSGMIFQSGSDVAVTGSDFAGSGCANAAFALQVNAISVDDDNGRGLLASGNTFTNATHGVFVGNMQELTIANAIPGGSAHYLVLEDNSGIGDLPGTSLWFDTVLTTTVTSVDLSSPTACTFSESGTGINASNSSHLTVTDVSVANRGSGMIFQSGSDVAVTGSDFAGSGCANAAFALQVNAISVDDDNGRGLIASGNTFTNANQGIFLENLQGLSITTTLPAVPSHHLVLEAGSGIGTVANTSLWISNVSTTTVENIDLSAGGNSRTGNGLYIVGGANLSIQGIHAKNRNNGVVVTNATDTVLSCSALINNSIGLNINQAATIVNNRIQDNTSGITMSGGTPLNAENNFWGAANGPQTIGGSGDAYNGNVDAQPFLTRVPPCAPQFIYALTTATTGAGSGSITLNPPGGAYDYGTVVTATVSAGITSTFAGWSGACTGMGACVIVVKADKAVSAAFNIATPTPTPTTPPPPTPTVTPTPNCPLVVLNVNDNGVGSLRQAIADAGVACSQIVFNASLTGQTIRLATELIIAKTVTIDGSGRKITISGDTNNDGSGDVSVFTVNAGLVTLRALTIANGFGADGLGGGVSISPSGRVDILQSTIRDNISDNGSFASAGGGIYNTGVLTLTNSTVSGNQAANFLGLGGGIHSSFGSVATIRYSTITGNSAPSDGVGGGINVEGGAVTLLGSIVSGNSATVGSAISVNNGGALVVNGRNIIGANGNPSMDGATPGATDIVPAGAVSTVINTTLADNGGDSTSHIIVTGGPAHEAIPANTPGCGTITNVDQRGVTRPTGAGCDIGAVELGSLPATPTPTATLPASDATAVAQPDQPATLTYSDPSGGGVAVQIPAGSVDQATTFLYDDQGTPSQPGAFQFAGRTFTLTAYRNNSEVDDFTFQQPITLVIDYTDSDVASVDENKLTLFFYDVDSGIWSEQGITVIARDPANNRITIQINHLTEFAMGTTDRIYLPVVNR